MKGDEASYLFVYGTLRTGFNHPVKQEIIDDMDWICESVIRGKLYDIGKYPGALRVTNNEPFYIKGEIFRIRHPKKVLRILDQYEGFDSEEPGKSEYFRDEELIQLPGGIEIKAWVYWYNFPVEGKRRIRQQDYLEYFKKKKLT